VKGGIKITIKIEIKRKAIEGCMRLLALGIFEDDVGDDVAGVAAAVNDFFEQFVEVFEDEDLEGVVFASEQVFVEGHHVPVGFAFEVLEFVVEVFDFLEIHAVAEGFDHLQDEVSGAFQQADLGGEINAAHELWRDEGAFAEFVHSLGDFVEGVGKGFDVLPLNHGDKGGIDCGADLFGNSLVLAAGMSELIQDGRLVEALAQLDKRLHAGAGFLSAGFEEREKFIFFAE